jgi:hypothetical protein
MLAAWVAHLPAVLPRLAAAAVDLLPADCADSHAVFVLPLPSTAVAFGSSSTPGARVVMHDSMFFRSAATTKTPEEYTVDLLAADVAALVRAHLGPHCAIKWCTNHADVRVHATSFALGVHVPVRLSHGL